MAPIHDLPASLVDVRARLRRLAAAALATACLGLALHSTSAAQPAEPVRSSSGGIIYPGGDDADAVRRGWHFRRDPRPPAPPASAASAPSPAAPAPAPSAQAPTIVVIQAPARAASEPDKLSPGQQVIAEQRKAVQRALEEAVAEPTLANAQKFLRMQNAVHRQGLAFADATRVAVLNDPSLDITLEGRPMATGPAAAYDQMTKVSRLSLAHDLGREHVLFYFFRSDCPFCRETSPAVRMVSDQTGLKVVAISLDGKGVPQFPDFRTDNGISQTLQVSAVPALFLANPIQKFVIPLGSGAMTDNELLERIATVSDPKNRQLREAAVRPLR